MNQTKTTCQICEREIKAKGGIIAHHGYKRPGNGWQTSSCMGARFQPYEVSADRIPSVIDTYKQWAEREEASAEEADGRATRDAVH